MQSSTDRAADTAPAAPAAPLIATTMRGIQNDLFVKSSLFAFHTFYIQQDYYMALTSARDHLKYEAPSSHPESLRERVVGCLCRAFHDLHVKTWQVVQHLEVEMYPSISVDLHTSKLRALDQLISSFDDTSLKVRDVMMSTLIHETPTANKYTLFPATLLMMLEFDSYTKFDDGTPNPWVRDSMCSVIKCLLSMCDNPDATIREGIDVLLSELNYDDKKSSLSHMLSCEEHDVSWLWEVLQPHVIPMKNRMFTLLCGVGNHSLTAAKRQQRSSNATTTTSTLLDSDVLSVIAGHLKPNPRFMAWVNYPRSRK